MPVELSAAVLGCSEKDIKAAEELMDKYDIPYEFLMKEVERRSDSPDINVVMEAILKWHEADVKQAIVELLDDLELDYGAEYCQGPLEDYHPKLHIDADESFYDDRYRFWDKPEDEIEIDMDLARFLVNERIIDYFISPPVKGSKGGEIHPVQIGYYAYLLDNGKWYDHKMKLLSEPEQGEIQRRLGNIVSAAVEKDIKNKQKIA